MTANYLLYGVVLAQFQTDSPEQTQFRFRSLKLDAFPAQTNRRNDLMKPNLPATSTLHMGQNSSPAADVHVGPSTGIRLIPLAQRSGAPENGAQNWRSHNPSTISAKLKKLSAIGAFRPAGGLPASSEVYVTPARGRPPLV
jgi:hypothetical protein